MEGSQGRRLASVCTHPKRMPQLAEMVENGVSRTRHIFWKPGTASDRTAHIGASPGNPSGRQLLVGRP
jgi:hypothetical protein